MRLRDVRGACAPSTSYLLLNSAIVILGEVFHTVAVHITQWELHVNDCLVLSCLFELFFFYNSVVLSNVFTSFSCITVVILGFVHYVGQVIL